MEIIPATHSNIARFINGIPKNKLPNVKSTKYVVDKKVSVCLYSCKVIKIGEELMYNYAGDTIKKCSYSNEGFYWFF